jgi:hypothetical protein
MELDGGRRGAGGGVVAVPSTVRNDIVTAWS